MPKWDWEQPIILKTVGTAVESGIDAITAINTVRAMAIDVETQRPILSNKFGGLSGTPIKPIALRCVYEISSKYDYSNYWMWWNFNLGGCS